MKASRPDWDTFLRIRPLIEGTYGVTIDLDDVELDAHDGELVWRVTMDNESVYVSHDGVRIIGGEDSASDGIAPELVVGAVLALLISVIAILWIASRRKGN